MKFFDRLLNRTNYHDVSWLCQQLQGNNDFTNINQNHTCFLHAKEVLCFSAIRACKNYMAFIREVSYFLKPIITKTDQPPSNFQSGDVDLPGWDAVWTLSGYQRTVKTQKNNIFIFNAVGAPNRIKSFSYINGRYITSDVTRKMPTVGTCRRCAFQTHGVAVKGVCNRSCIVHHCNTTYTVTYQSA